MLLIRIFAANMKRPGKKKLFKWIKIVLLLYVLIGISLYSLQDKIIFRSRSLPPDYRFSFDQPFNEVNIPYSEEKKISIVQFTVPDSLRKGVVLYFHGNRKNITRYAPYADNFTKNHYEVWMIDYPGYGKSTGEPGEQAMYDDALLLYKLANSRFPADSIIIYGKSLGTGPATWLASRKSCQRLILETPYYSLDALARNYFPIYPVSTFLHTHFPSYDYAKNVSVPVSIFHGTSDWVIPYRQSKRLKPAFPKGAELVTIPGGGHNNLDDYPLFHQKLDSLLKVP